MRPTVLTVCLLLPAAALGKTPTCDALGGEQRKLADELLGSSFAYDCCDDTLAAYLKAQPPCKLVVRLAEAVCRRVAKGQTRADVERALQKRALSMTPGSKKAEIAVDEAMGAGDAKAPVVVVEYACTRCPYCSLLTPRLHKEVAEGRLKGKVRLYFRPFPIRGHEGAIEGGNAFMAAAKLGRFWPYALHLYERYDDYEPDKLVPWAPEVGLDKAAFQAALDDPATRDALVAAKKEGLRNKVRATPTLFINGRQYVHDLDLEVLVDALEEEHERLTDGGGG